MLFSQIDKIYEDGIILIGRGVIMEEITNEDLKELSDNELTSIYKTLESIDEILEYIEGCENNE